MKYKQRTILLYKDENHTLRLLKITDSNHEIRYQTQLNRKVQYTSTWEWLARKAFAMMVQNIVLQLKIFD